MEKPRIIVQMIVKNEEKRYLKAVLKDISRSVDEIIVLDDASTDRTVEICKSFPKVCIEINKTSIFERDESKLRGQLWEIVRKKLRNGIDWVLTSDADEIFDEVVHQELPHLVLTSYDWISFHLLDMWNKKDYRIDGYWSPVVTRLFRFKNLPYNISGEIHCKNIPRYVYESSNGLCRADINLKHLGYLKEEDRQKKYNFYSKKSVGLDYIHTLSINEKPRLKKINGKKYFNKVLITSLIKDRDWCIKPFLEGIFNLDYLKEFVTLHFIVNDSVDDSFNILQDWKNMVKKYYSDVIIEVRNFGNISLKEHDWDDQKLHNMTIMRNMYLQKAKDLKSDYVFTIDNDVLIKDPNLLKHLINLDRDVVGEIHWAKWGKFEEPLPNAWIQGQYEITDKFVELLKRPSCYPVGGVCGCSLISKDIIDSGVDYSRIYNLPQMIRGEDRFFCISAHAHKFVIWIDTCYPCEHMEQTVKQQLITAKRKSKSKISLCMIAKNEQDYIRQALECVQLVVDNSIVIDTGSDDKTIEIAHEYAFPLISYEWKDNFSSARNKSLEYAYGDWILQLDPDEYILPDDRIKILEMAQDKSVDAYLFSIKNFLEDPAKNPNAKYALSESYRMFKNDPEIFYTGVVHEGIENQLEKLSEKRKVKVVAAPIFIWHFGYLKDKKLLEKKYEYYSSLYEKRISKNNKDSEAYMSLALHNLYVGKIEDAEKYYRKVLLLERNWRVYNNLGVLRRENGNLEEAMNFFESAKEFLPDNINPIYKQKIEDNIFSAKKRDFLSDIIA